MHDWAKNPNLSFRAECESRLRDFNVMRRAHEIQTHGFNDECVHDIECKFSGALVMH